MAYLDLVEPDPDKNRRNGLIIFVISVILLGALVKCAGQTCYTRSKPYADNQKITRILSCDGLQGEVNDKYAFISIFADSINPHDYTISLYVVLDKKSPLKHPKLILSFDDKEIHECEPYYFDIKTGYVEFNMKAVNFLKLRTHKVDYVNFVNDGISYYAEETKINLFYDFMRGL